MGRPSVAVERRGQIITAASSCIARLGLAGTTLEEIARESGLSRSHIRHYLGNRDRIIDAVWDATIAPYLANCRRGAEAIADTPAGEILDTALTFFFGDEMLSNEDLPVFDAILNGSMQDARLRGVVEAAYDELFGYLLRVVAAVVPHADRAEVEQTAFAIYALATGTSSSTRLRTFSGYRHTARSSAQRIVEDLCLRAEPVLARGR